MQDIVAQRLARLTSEQREKLKQLVCVKAAAPSHSGPVRRTPGCEIPLSSGQRRLWFLHQFDPNTVAYNETNTLRFTHAFNVSAFQQAFADMVERHEILRTSIEVRDGQPYSIVYPALRTEIPVVDLRHLPAPKREPEVHRRAAEQSRIPFDFSVPPLFRAALYRLDVADHILALTMSHLIADGWSLGIVAIELTTFYWSRVAGTPAPLNELPIQYGDFAVWQHNALKEGDGSKHLAYWIDKLESLSPLELPADKPRPVHFTYRGSRVPVHIDSNLLQNLVFLAETTQASLFMVLLAVFATLLSRYTAQDDIAIGSPLAGRNYRALESLIGLFITTLVLRVDTSGDPRFLDFVDRVRQTTGAAIDHADVPFEVLVDRLQPVRDTSRHPLFGVMFQLFQGLKVAGDVKIPSFLPVETGISKVDLSLELVHANDEVRGHIEFNTDLFEHGRIERMATHFLRIAEAVCENPASRLSEIPLLSDEELHRMLNEWNATETAYPKDADVASIFRERVAASADAPAIEYEGQILTYRELDEASDRLAQQLLEAGVVEGDNIGIYQQRSPQVPVAMLAILKVGAAYVPLETAYPDARLQQFIRDCGVRVVIGSAESTQRAEALGVVFIVPETSPKAAAPRRFRATSPAYIMFTSGTIGRPKGVVVSHQNILRTVCGVDYVRLEDQRMMLFAPLSFDASTFEIWGCLLNGSCLVIHPPGLPSLHELGAFIQANQITLLWATTLLFCQLCEACPNQLRGLEQVYTGGEVAPPNIVRTAWEQLPRTSVYNCYGPTECTIFSTAWPFSHPDEVIGSVPIGRPISNTKVYVLDRYGRPQPPGIPGELYIGGDGVALGYWNREELTAARFIPDRFAGSGGMYRTGDVVSWTDQGVLLFHHRVDRQVKVSGYRIELGEIEAALQALPSVQAAVVMAEDTGEKRLVAFVQRKPGSALSAHDIRLALALRLPDYMVPSQFDLVTSLPLTANGKLDSTALLKERSRLAFSAREPVSPRNDLERELQSIWADLLHIAPPGVEDTFFELGGQSLVATRLLSRVRTKFSATVSMRDFFDNPTIVGLARLVEQQSEERRLEV